jgi:glycosyltransferase involved in cell wall biosynthesis
LAAAPDDTETIVEAFKKLWCDDDLAEDLRRKGRKRASQFSWKRTARETVAVYRRVLE